MTETRGFLYSFPVALDVTEVTELGFTYAFPLAIGRDLTGRDGRGFPYTFPFPFGSGTKRLEIGGSTKGGAFRLAAKANKGLGVETDEWNTIVNALRLRSIEQKTADGEKAKRRCFTYAFPLALGEK